MSHNNRGMPESECAEVIVGIDIGGTGTRILAMTPERDVLARLTVNTPKTLSGRTATAFLAGHIQEVVEGHRPVAIGIGASGPIDSTGTIQNPDTVPGFTGVPLCAELTDIFGIPVSIGNDAVCAAVAEHNIGAGRGYASLLHVTLGTGIGAAFLMDGVPVRSGDGQHPESGHISVPGVTNPCYCGRNSCWEQAASRQVIQRAASHALGLTATDHSAIGKLAALAQDGDSRAINVFNDYGERIASGLSTLLAIHRPRAVALGGSGAEHFAFFHDSLSRSLSVLGDWISSPVLLKTELDDYGGAIGSAIVAQQKVASARFSA